MESRVGNWTTTYSGVKFWPLDPRVSEITIEDIAHHLAHICRWGGAVRSFYSVAQHSVHVSQILPPELRLEGLLHDASEAYLGDLIRPIKDYSTLGKTYKELEANLNAVIGIRFGIPAEMSAEVAWADNMLLAAEARELMHPLALTKWRETTYALPFSLHPVPSHIAEEMFLSEYYSLVK